MTRRKHIIIFCICCSIIFQIYSSNVISCESPEANPTIHTIYTQLDDNCTTNNTYSQINIELLANSVFQAFFFWLEKIMDRFPFIERIVQAILQVIVEYYSGF